MSQHHVGCPCGSCEQQRMVVALQYQTASCMCHLCRSQHELQQQSRAFMDVVAEPRRSGLVMTPDVVDGGTGRVIAFAVMFERTIVDENGHAASVFIGTTAQQRARDVLQPHSKRTAFTVEQLRDIASRLTVDSEGFPQDDTHYSTTVERRGGVYVVAGPDRQKGVQ